MDVGMVLPFLEPWKLYEVLGNRHVLSHMEFCFDMIQTAAKRVQWKLNILCSFYASKVVINYPSVAVSYTHLTLPTKRIV